ncbi:PH domain-containing protein [Sanguibacter antarcticus]|uniref:Putative membrane protein n=1 Tax=Sanguibacter antarcticus TaxID=372484 RepID=A0A2A9EAH1_9MICO|nr:PH domain-containing protein [Sanguibacter antarcticus]PFG35252.1 putative membrane protein [Sanguibacter antarcticus]
MSTGTVGPTPDVGPDRPDGPDRPGGPGKAGEPDGPADGLAWRRLHPVTPLVRGWAVIAVVLFILAQRSVEALPSGGSVLPTDNVWIIVAGIAVIGLVGGVYAWLSWRVTRYAYDADAVHVHSGILFRKQRKVRLDRLQAIDVVKPLLARFFGLAELKLEVAGGPGSNVKLGFLRDAEASALRNALLARAAGVEEDPDGTAAVEAPERPVLDVQPGRLIGSLLLSGATIVLVLILVGSSVAAIASRSGAPFVAVFSALLGLGPFVATRFTGEFGFTGAISPDGIRLRRGLLETRSQTIPPGRVQAIRLRQSLLWRMCGWWRVDVNVAGYGIETDGNQTNTVLLPVGTRDDALRALWLVLPDLGVEDPVGLLDAALVGSGPAAGFTSSPRSARWVDPLAWRRNGFFVMGRGLLVRRGRLVRTVEVVPHERTQSLALVQGPLQRRFGVASFVVHSTAGPVSPRVPHLSGPDAASLLRDQAERARYARQHAGPERWMQVVVEGDGQREQVTSEEDGAVETGQAPDTGREEAP